MSSSTRTAGVLGNLKYTERENGWALQFGYNLGFYEMLSLSPPMEDGSFIKEKERAACIRDMNRDLEKHNIELRIIDSRDEDAIVWLVQDLLDEFGRHSSSAQLAFIIIGKAVFYFVTRSRSVDLSDMAELLLREAYYTLETLLYRCEDANVQLDALFIHLSQCGSLRSVRKMLRTLETPLKILMVSADPQDQRRLQLSKEARALQNALQSGDRSQFFKFTILPSCRPQDLASALRRNRPTYVHFSGHGSEEGLCFEDNDGNAVLIEKERLAGLLSLACENGLKGVVLNACYTTEQAGCIADKVGHVVAMDGLVYDDDAIAFASQFYEAIADGEEFGKAFAWALAGTGLAMLDEQKTPKLIRSRLFEEAHHESPNYGTASGRFRDSANPNESARSSAVDFAEGATTAVNEAVRQAVPAYSETDEGSSRLFIPPSQGIPPRQPNRGDAASARNLGKQPQITSDSINNIVRQVAAAPMPPTRISTPPFGPSARRSLSPGSGDLSIIARTMETASNDGNISQFPLERRPYEAFLARAGSPNLKELGLHDNFSAAAARYEETKK